MSLRLRSGKINQAYLEVEYHGFLAFYIVFKVDKGGSVGVYQALCRMTDPSKEEREEFTKRIQRIFEDAGGGIMSKDDLLGRKVQLYFDVNTLRKWEFCSNPVNT